MLTIWDHLLLFGAFFLIGVIVGFAVTQPAMAGGKYWRM